MHLQLFYVLYTRRLLTDTDLIDEDIRSLEEKLTAVTEMLRLCMEENETALGAKNPVFL